MLNKFLTIVFFFFLGYLAVKYIFTPLILPDKYGLDRTWVSVGDNKVRVLIADTEKEREKGLSDRKSLCQDCGMLFVFDKKGIYPFWMRRMYIDIDILWILDDRVMDITYDAKKPSAEEFDSPKAIYTPRISINKVLEVNSGWVEKNGIKTGERIAD